MIGKDENQEEVTFKVADRRKFNPDGSVKEGVTLDAAPPPTKVAEKPVELPANSPIGEKVGDGAAHVELANVRVGDAAIAPCF